MIGWTLIVALLLALVVPVHYHLHHNELPQSDASAGHGHAADLHILVGSDESHHPDGGHVLTSTPDITSKNIGVQLPVFFALLAVALLVPAGMQVVRPVRLAQPQRIPRSNRHTTPPLRAPPRG